ncbi:MAG: nuclear transport factor 2 family protein [Synechococcales cyanobacterium RU_4_20]|nr:nuclear transport factor 2 family protein [Synechococcales cyanobacterium RU_4_20]
MSQRALFSTVTRWAMLGALGIGLGLCTPAGAKGTAMAPPKVAQLVEQMDTAASARDLTRLLATYSPNFVHGDGLDRKAFSRSLEQFWNQYPNLTYKTEVVAWTENRQGGVAENANSDFGHSPREGPGVCPGSNPAESPAF